MIKIPKNLLIAGIAVVVIVLVVILYFVFAGGAQPTLVSVEAKTGNITQTVDLTGKVSSSEGVDLAFETSGKIVANYVKTGDKIYAGQYLIAIDSSLLQAQLQQAQAQLDALNIDTVNSKSNAVLQALYANSLVAAQKSVSTAKDILLTISDIQYNHFTVEVQRNLDLQAAKEKAVSSLLGQSGAGLWTSQGLGQLDGGAFGLVQTAINNPTQSNIDAALLATQTALQDINNMVSAVPIDTSLSASERASISAAKTNINLEIITTSANVQAIASLKVNNSATVSTTNAQIQGAQANINAIKTQISKTVLKALFDGQVDKNNALAGQIVLPNVPVITISNNTLQISTNVPEINLAGIKVGDSADVTLDAFGNSRIFRATAVSVDSAPTIVNGVSVYGAKLKFNSQDSSIIPGMTANITIISQTHPNVLTVLKSAVIQNNNEYLVIVDKGNSKKEVRKVTVGLSDDKNIEIISGLQAGEKVFAY